MRKREIEKLLQRAVAEALGVELNPSGRQPIEAESRKQASGDHRAAA